MSLPSEQIIGDKANWDATLTKTFIDVCVERQKAGDRPNTHFSREGWKNVIVDFKAKTGRSYDQVQLKNKWDNLKKEWRLWEKLVFGETGLGWDDQRHTVLADNEWWERKIKEDRKCAKFRNQGIENREELQFLFGGQAVTGQHAFMPSATIFPQAINDETAPTEEDEHHRGVEEKLLSGDDNSTDPEYNANADIAADVQSSPTPPPRASRRSTTPGSRVRRKRKASDVRDEINNSLGQLVTAVQSRTSTVGSVYNSGNIDEVMLMLEEFPQTAAGGPLLRFALTLFEKRENREWFLGIGRKNWQMEWLQAKYDEATGGGSLGSH
ncbi:L10-interacting MYB domain-containing protein-like [Tripterygium wilfordii]|uniref:L10-interacting MYB domain-containing protein-like n=1 Tax=Tripterygium wilfordii TaxID=458696 RepID=UPI0018F7EE53|nr:L10-interacting MYB domain-containing protein-like [Tripterygium wilfordii]